MADAKSQKPEWLSRLEAENGFNFVQLARALGKQFSLIPGSEHNSDKVQKRLASFKYVQDETELRFDLSQDVNGLLAIESMVLPVKDTSKTKPEQPYEEAFEQIGRALFEIATLQNQTHHPFEIKRLNPPKYKTKIIMRLLKGEGADGETRFSQVIYENKIWTLSDDGTLSSKSIESKANVRARLFDVIPDDEREGESHRQDNLPQV